MMINDVNELLVVALTSVLHATWRTLPLLAVVVFVDRLTMSYLAAGWRCCLWMLVVVRLLLPFAIESQFSWSAVFDRWVTPAASLNQATGSQAQVFTFSDGRQVFQQWSPTPNANPTMSATADRQVGQLSTHVAHRVELALAWIWFLVAVVLIVRIVLSHNRLMRHLRQCEQVSNPEIVNIFIEIQKHFGIKCKPRLVLSDLLRSPAVFGWWNPTVCLPAEFHATYTPDQLRQIFKHELAHICRGDGLWLTISSIMRALHWFHPISWWTHARLRATVEHAADETATRGLSPDAIGDYGRLLIQITLDAQRIANAHHRHSLSSSLVTIASTNGLNRRIKLLGHRRLPVRSGAVIAIAMIGCLATAAMTESPGVAATLPKPKEAEFRIDGRLLEDPWTGLAPLNTATHRRDVTFDVTRALEKAREVWKHPNADQWLAAMLAVKQDATPVIVDGRLSMQLSADEERSTRLRLAAFEESGPWQIVWECRVIDAELHIAQKFSWNAEDLRISRIDSDAHHRPALAARLSDAEMTSFMRQVQGKPENTMIQAPRVTVFNGQPITVEEVVTRGFMSQIEAVEAPGEETKLGLQLVPEGWAVSIHGKVIEHDHAAELSPSRHGFESGIVALDCRLRESRIHDVRLAELPISQSRKGFAPWIVQIPQIEQTSLAVQCRLATDETLIIAVPPTLQKLDVAPKPPTRFYALTPRLLKDSQQ